MGISSRDFHLVAELFRQGHIPRRPRVVEVGAQQIANDLLRDPSEVVALGRVLGAALPPPLPDAPPEGNAEPELLSREAPLARPLWEWLGFTYAAIDVDRSPGSIPLDLNFDSVPREQRGRYDLVTNFGTTEHVMNQLNAFRVIHDLTRVGGVMLHRLPAQGHLTHGLINYDPKFFWLLARANGYRWLAMDFDLDANRPRGVPPSIPANIRPFSADVDARLGNYAVTDAAIVAGLQKLVDMEFVPPLDVPQSFTAEDEATRQRYWSIIEPERLARRFNTRLYWWNFVRVIYLMVQVGYRIFPPLRIIRYIRRLIPR